MVDQTGSSVECCTLCKNRCPLSNPKCAMALSPEAAARREEAEKRDASVCKICGKRCPYTSLQCETGRTIARIKGMLPSDA